MANYYFETKEARGAWISGVFYTQKEITEKRFSYNQAFSTAAILLKEKHKYTGSICTDAIPRHVDGSDITMTTPNFNQVVSDLYTDTLT